MRRVLAMVRRAPAWAWLIAWLLLYGAAMFWMNPGNRLSDGSRFERVEVDGGVCYLWHNGNVSDMECRWEKP